MKKLTKGLLACGVAMSLLSTANVAEAHYYNCRYIPGHYAGGFYRPAHRVCWGYTYNVRPYYEYGYTRCGWVPGHWANGYWYPAHKACWR